MPYQMLVGLTEIVEGSEPIQVRRLCIFEQLVILSGDLSRRFSDPLKARVAQGLERKLIVSDERFMKVDQDEVKNVPKSHFSALGDHQ